MILEIDKNRLNYAELLSPPNNFTLKKAIATTYSLDLFTLLSIPISLFYAKEPDANIKNDSIEILAAIEKTKDIVSVFCQKGKIKIPKDFNHLFSYLEDAVFEIAPNQFDASFHPKIWILRYENQQSKEILYRTIILSRNMTFDRSADISYFSEGLVSKDTKNNNTELIDFIKFLSQQGKKSIDKSFINDLKKVNFTLPSEVNRQEFHPILLFNTPKEKYSNPLSTHNFDKILIISPFIDKKTLQHFLKIPKRKYLFSRKEELDGISKNIIQQFNAVYYLNPDVIDGESFIDEEDFISSKRNLHAKIFIGEKNNNYEMYLGSANCTTPAFERNIEFLVKLKSTNKNYSVERIKKSLLINEDYFLPYKSPIENINIEDEDVISLRRLEFTLTNSVFKGKIIPNKNNYDLILDYNIDDLIANNFIVKIKPYNHNKSQSIKNQGEGSLTFTDIGLKELSSFIEITVFENSKIILSLFIKADIDIPIERNKSIFSTLVNSSEKFYKYIQLLLSNNNLSEINTLTDTLQISSNNNTNNQSLFYGMPLFESLLIASSRNKDSLKDVDKLIEKLKSDSKIIPKEFIDFWGVFKIIANKK